MVSPLLTQASYYYLKVVDSCGNESAASPQHRNIYLSASTISGGMISLDWNTYSGNPYGVSQNVWRSINGGAFINLSQVSLTTTSYTDSTPPAGNKRYLIELVLGINCNPTINKKVEYLHIYSNLLHPGSSGLDAFKLSDAFEVYPNPTTGLVKITAIKAGITVQSVQVVNMLGSTVKEQLFEGISQEISIELDGLADGVYQLLILSGNGMRYPVKVVLNRGL